MTLSTNKYAYFFQENTWRRGEKVYISHYSNEHIMYICIYYTCLYNIVGTQSSYYEMVKKKIGIWTSAIFSKKKKKKIPSEIVEEKIVITKSL